MAIDLIADTLGARRQKVVGNTSIGLRARLERSSKADYCLMRTLSALSSEISLWFLAKRDTSVT
ncbi:hypothetical protein GJR93_09610 [Aminobacter sp. MDW-2]|jgi:hypothetical protein|nr:hypothetical protein [Aminobacter sp. MDW-2]